MSSSAISGREIVERFHLIHVQLSGSCAISRNSFQASHFPLKAILLCPLNDYHLIFHYASASPTIRSHHEHCSYLIRTTIWREEEMMRFCVCDARATEHRQDGTHNKVNNGKDESRDDVERRTIMKRWESFSRFDSPTTLCPQIYLSNCLFRPSVHVCLLPFL
jgi:hypothetical protein